MSNIDVIKPVVAMKIVTENGHLINVYLILGENIIDNICKLYVMTP